MEKIVRRVFVEKKDGFDVEAQGLFNEIKESIGIHHLEGIRIVNRYDVEGLSEEEYVVARDTIFSEKTVDVTYDEELPLNSDVKIFAVEYLPGQYDQRADFASQCIAITSGHSGPLVNFAKMIVVSGDISLDEFAQIKNYCINPVDSREAMLGKPDDLEFVPVIPDNVEVLKGFNEKTDDELKQFMKAQSLAMNFEDLKFCQDYFKNTEGRDPFITEIKVIDTYWSDHCRHTTFLTKINRVTIQDGKFSAPILNSFDEYLKTREALYTDKERNICLMDMAVIAVKELKAAGKLDDLDVSDEINACSIVINAEIDGKDEEWLLMFKNETHNHPTEIEPFGGAATCIGGAIRDPLSGRTYVYQAMRVTGSADPRTSLEDTIPGKLPQKKITQGAAHGYSSYGNQIGLATGHVAEIYHEGYVAKRMEVGAVIAAAPKENVYRKAPEAGDLIILLGGRTGRDGCGGATGSSKEHDEESILTCGAEVQKGNAPTERKIQRLFRNPKVSTLIKKCNDFGAGGISVAIGELSEGLKVNLDLVPKKYDGLDGTELAISESQERMAVVVRKEDAESFIQYALEENLEAVVVAEVTDNKRLEMKWRGNTIVDLSRAFLDTNGVTQTVDVTITTPAVEENYFTQYKKYDQSVIAKLWKENIENINVCSQKGLVERFDATIGAGTVLMPFGGKYQATPTEAMVAKIPVTSGVTTTGSIMSHGYNPYLSTWSPYHGALYAVVEAVAKVVAVGGDYKNTRLTFQEYFEKPGKTPERWGKPTAALLGALHAQRMFEIAAIGGKDSMSGTFKDIDVPPTLVAFAVDVVNVNKVISPEFKKANSKVVLFKAERDENEIPVFEKLKAGYDKINELIATGKIIAAHTVKFGGIAEAITKMTFGNKVGFDFNAQIHVAELFAPDYGSLVLEVTNDAGFGDIAVTELGTTTESFEITVAGTELSGIELYANFEKPLEKIFPTRTKEVVRPLYTETATGATIASPVIKVAKPKVFIPVFPGTNCEYDTKLAFERAGAEADVMVLKNLTPEMFKESIKEMAAKIRQSQIVMMPGGFSAGDEPEGSGKFIAAVFRNPEIKEEVMNLLKNRDGLMLGICNGFQALIKLGLVPYGEIRDIDETSPTLTYNNIGRHISRIVTTKIASNKSPWLAGVSVGDMHSVAVSHGEGRFIGSDEMIKSLFKNGQVATQYVDFNGNPTYDIEFNPNGSYSAIEGITSPDGRVFGKMGHSERIGANVYKNIQGNKDQQIFESGVKYFK